MASPSPKMVKNNSEIKSPLKVEYNFMHNKSPTSIEARDVTFGVINQPQV